jgi:cob(I)alamin adenosyltransferase
MRISKVTTKTGDSGETSLGDGCRTSKAHVRIHTLGSVDHLNSIIGWVKAVAEESINDDLEKIQHDLFNLGGELSTPDLPGPLLSSKRLVWLEQEIEKMNQGLPPLKEFILPGGSELSTRIHIARTECRSAERDLIALSEKEETKDLHKAFLNRLSDYLFVLGRTVYNQDGNQEIQWDHNKDQ